MKITIIYDNENYKKGFIPEWGFSSLVEVENGPTILFDTGGDAEILSENMKKLGIEKESIDEIFISHNHWDHIGGLMAVFPQTEAETYIPPSCKKLDMEVPAEYEEFDKLDRVKVIKDSQKLHENIYSTGELDNMEQSLVVKTDKGLVVIVGCSHPGVGKILDAASKWGNIYGIVGGLHGFNDFQKLEGLELIGATHCTEYKKEIEERFPEQFLAGGVGRIIEI